MVISCIGINRLAKSTFPLNSSPLRVRFLGARRVWSIMEDSQNHRWIAELDRITQMRDDRPYVISRRMTSTYVVCYGSLRFSRHPAVFLFFKSTIFSFPCISVRSSSIRRQRDIFFLRILDFVLFRGIRFFFFLSLA